MGRALGLGVICLEFKFQLIVLLRIALTFLNFNFFIYNVGITPFYGRKWLNKFIWKYLALYLVMDVKSVFFLQKLTQRQETRVPQRLIPALATNCWCYPRRLLKWFKGRVASVFHLEKLITNQCVEKFACKELIHAGKTAKTWLAKVAYR